MIEEYHFGSITIDGKTHSSDVINTSGKVDPWWREESHRVYIEDIKKVAETEPPPEVMVFGTGDPGLMKTLPETEKYIKSKRIWIIIKPSRQAVEEYNKLEKEGKKVVGLFHLTC